MLGEKPTFRRALSPSSGSMWGVAKFHRQLYQWVLLTPYSYWFGVRAVDGVNSNGHLSHFNFQVLYYRSIVVSVFSWVSLFQKLAKARAFSLHATEALGGRKYSSYLFSTSALHGLRGQRHAQAALQSRGKGPRYPLYRRLGGPQSRSGHRG
jgi:hypothetical protein